MVDGNGLAVAVWAGFVGGGVSPRSSGIGIDGVVAAFRRCRCRCRVHRRATRVSITMSQVDEDEGNQHAHPHYGDYHSLLHCPPFVRERQNPQSQSGHGYGRRSFLTRTVVGAASSTAWSPLLTAPNIASSSALPSFTNPSSERRQLELCLVAVLRTEYWAMAVARLLNTQLLLLLPPPSNVSSVTTTKEDDDETQQLTPEMTDNQRKSPYLEARLGAKALLTQKIGGGANSRVRTLGSFQLKECLDDAKYWCREYAQKNPSLLSTTVTITSNTNSNAAKRICSIDLTNAIDDLIDSLATIVEFDGLETTIDPSPRSSLMLSMYNNQKGTFVYRTLLERVVPSCERILAVFGRERRRIVEEFVRSNYYGEEISIAGRGATTGGIAATTKRIYLA